MTFNAKIYEEDDGSYWAEVEELPGCFASGATLDELREALIEAISIYVADSKTAVLSGHPRRPRSLTGHIDRLRVLVPA